MSDLDISRREVLRASGATGLLLAFGWSAGRAAEASAAVVNNWLRIAHDGIVTVFCNITEMGQGTSSAIPQIVADELDLPWDRVRVEQAPVAPIFFNVTSNYGTFGSFGVYTQFEKLRAVGAAARAMLVQAAAVEWQALPRDCETTGGHVIHRPTGRCLGYGTLASAAARLPVPTDAPPKPREQWKLIGTSVPRLDLAAKVDGSAIYGIDVKRPGLRVATIRRCPVFGGKLRSVDDAPALAVKGVRQVVRLDDAVAVVADGYWPAKKGLDALSLIWDLGPNAAVSSSEISRHMREAVRNGRGATMARRTQDPIKLAADHAAVMATATDRYSATYEVPFLAHAPLEPMNGTAQVGPDSAELWLPVQTQSLTRDAVARELGLPPERVTIHTTMVGGGFGRRMETDYARQAAAIARASGGGPVKLIWSREQDMTGGYYRPAVAATLTAGTDAAGQLLAVRFATASARIGKYSVFPLDKNKLPPFDGTVRETIDDSIHLLPNLHATWADVDFGVPCAYWRSVGASQNVFFVESFLDELAMRAKADPMLYRLAMLQPRGQRALRAAAEVAGWNRPPPAGRYRGIAVSETNRTVVAQIVELSVSREKAIKIHKITCAIDCGIVVNPDSVRAQTEGCIVWGLSAAMGAITLADGRIEQTNFDAYPLLTLAQTPPVRIEILPPEGDHIGGVGEEAVPPVAPAIANAIFAATGERIRELPLSKHGYTYA